MKILLLLAGVFLIFCGNAAAQDTPGVANGSIQRNSRDDYDNGIRMRSIELQRVKEESYRSAAAKKAAENRRINFAEIKKDFELIQKFQDEIVKTYVTGKQIDYARIAEMSGKLHEAARRLHANLALYEEKEIKKSAGKTAEPEAVKDCIVAIDKALGNFVTSPIFKNLNVLETKDAEKAEIELRKILRFSELLAQKAKENQ